MEEQHTYIIKVNGEYYTALLWAENNMMTDYEINCNYPHDHDMLLSFLYEWPASAGDVREYEELDGTHVRIEVVEYTIS